MKQSPESHSFILLCILYILLTLGVTFVGDSVYAYHIEMHGSLPAINKVLESILFGPNMNFFGYAAIDWKLSNVGAATVHPTNGTLTITVGAVEVLPILVPISSTGVLAGFKMTELTTSEPFAGITVTDGKQTSQTIYSITIQSFEGKLIVGDRTDLEFETETDAKQVFTCLPDAMNRALASFTFKSAAYSTGNAGFVISVTNTFHQTNGFIQGSIQNEPATMSPVDGALPPPSISDITASGATATWQAAPDSFKAKANVPSPTGYILQVATSTTGPWTTIYSGPLLTHKMTGLSRATGYYVQVLTVNDAGEGPASPAARFSTLPNGPSAPVSLTVTKVTSNSVSLSWQPPLDNGGGSINMYKIQTQPTDRLGTDQGILVAVTGASSSPSYTVSGLASGVSYTFYVVANNAGGSSPSSNQVQQSTLGPAPVIVSYVASGPSTAPNVYSNQVTLTITFNMNTNQPDVSTTAALNSLFKFKPSIGTEYSGTWTNAQTLSIRLVNVGSASPTIGVATVVVIGALTAQNGNSPYSTSKSPALSGSFGSSGSLGGTVLITNPDYKPVTSVGQPIGLGVSIDISQLYPDGLYQLVVSVISPLLPGSSLSGEGFSAPGLVVSVVGTPAVIQSALTNLVYTPAPGFTGTVSFSFQLTNKVTGELLSSLVTSLTVRSDVALPTVTAPDTTDVVLEQFTGVQGISVGSTDLSSQSNSMFVVTISTSSTGQSMLSEGVSGVQYTPVVGTAATTHELIGSLSQLNSALGKLQVKFTFGSNSAQQNYAPEPYTISIEIADMNVAASSTSQPNSAIRTIIAKINCNTKNIAPTKVVQAILDNNQNGIVVNLDNPVSDEYLSTPVFECNSMLTDVSLLGDSPVCHWISTTAFRVEFGIGAKFVPGKNTLTIRDGSLQRCRGGSNDAPSQSFGVDLPTAAAAPRVFISGPSTTSLCNTLVLLGISPMVGGRNPTYNWVLPRNINPRYAPTDMSAMILEVNPLAFGDGGSFEFGLSVTNFLGQTSNYYRKVITVTNLPVPLIFPTSLTEVETTTSQTINIYNSITTNPCFGEPLKPMTFEWSFNPSLPTDSKVVLNTANLVIPRNTLTPNSVYNATLKVASSTNSALYSTIEYTLRIEAAKLHARIAGGEWRKVRMDASGWTVDASVSVDEDALSMNSMLLDFGRVSKVATEGDGSTTTVTSFDQSDYAADKYTYQWKCTAQDGGACYSGIDGKPLAFTDRTQSVLTFQPNSLKIGQYTFTVVYTHTPSGRTDQTSTVIAIREGVNPQPYGASGTVDILLDAMENLVNPQGKIHLRASLPSYYADSTSDLVYTWSVLGGGSTPLNLDDASNVQGLHTSTLILNPRGVDGFFVPGTDYHFRVTVQHKDDPQGPSDAGSAMAYVKINSLPVCDSLITSPIESGTAFNTSFVVHSVSCYDPDDNNLLNYQFFRLDEQGNQFNLLPNSHAPLGRVPFFPTGARSNNYALTVGVIVSDGHNGQQEYTKDVKVIQNPNINGIPSLISMYTQTWSPNMAISGDSETWLVIIGAILTEVNELASKNTLSASETADLIAFKRTLLADIQNIASILPAMQVSQTLFELLEDTKNIDLDMFGTVLAFLTNRVKNEPGVSTDRTLMDQYMRIIKNGLDYVVKASGVVSTSGSSRRLFAMDPSNMVASKSFTLTATSTGATPATIIDDAYALMNLLALDVSSRALMLQGETYPIDLKNTNGFSGAVGRGAVGQATNVSTSDGYSVIASSAAFSDLSKGAFVDLSVFGTNPVPYIGMVSAGDASTIVSGGAAVAAFTPKSLSQSTPLTSFSGVEVEIPFNIALSACIEGDSFKPFKSDDPAPNNVFGNMCQLGCKVWNGQSFTDSAATMVALLPLSRKVVCGLSAPGIAVVYNTRLKEPYVRPNDDSPGTDVTNRPKQPNGLPWGVVRASMLIRQVPTIYDLNTFKGQVIQDLAMMVSVPSSRMAIQAASTAGGESTIIWDFLAPTATSAAVSQDLYDKLISYEQADFAPTVYMKNVDVGTISQLCDDGEYRHECNASESAKWELPVIIAVCCFVVLCCIGSIVFACIKLRRRSAGGKMQPPVAVGEAEPAKKFVYTAPNGENVPSEESVSEVVLRPNGQDFEPSSHSISDESGSKNRLSARFPNRAPSISAAGLAGAAGMGAAVGAASVVAPEDSRSSHHFFYVDDSKAGTPSNGHRLSRSDSVSHQGAHFTIEGSQSRDISSRSSSSQSMASRSTSNPTTSGGFSESGPPSPISSTAASSSYSRDGMDESQGVYGQRKTSLDGISEEQLKETEKEKDKAPLPVLRPSRSPKTAATQ